MTKNGPTWENQKKGQQVDASYGIPPQGSTWENQKLQKGPRTYGNPPDSRQMPRPRVLGAGVGRHGALRRELRQGQQDLHPAEARHSTRPGLLRRVPCGSARWSFIFHLVNAPGKTNISSSDKFLLNPTRESKKRISTLKQMEVMGKIETRHPSCCGGLTLKEKPLPKNS